MWRIILTKVPGSSPGNDSYIVFFTVVIPALEAGTSVQISPPHYPDTCTGKPWRIPARSMPSFTARKRSKRMSQ